MPSLWGRTATSRSGHFPGRRCWRAGKLPQPGSRTATNLWRRAFCQPNCLRGGWRSRSPGHCPMQRLVQRLISWCSVLSHKNNRGPKSIWGWTECLGRRTPWGAASWRFFASSVALSPEGFHRLAPASLGYELPRRSWIEKCWPETASSTGAGWSASSTRTHRSSASQLASRRVRPACSGTSTCSWGPDFLRHQDFWRQPWMARHHCLDWSLWK